MLDGLVLTGLFRYVRGAYPPLPSLLLAGSWASGVTGLYATLTRDPHWRPGWPVLLGAATIALDMLLMRIVDDIRDLPYDRVTHPGRPLPSGVVGVRTLLVTYAVLAAALVTANLGCGPAPWILAAQLCYAIGLLAADRWLRWPDPDRLVVTVLVTSPVQVLLHVYLWVGYRTTTGPALWWGLAVVACASLHLELVKHLTRRPAPGERSYVDTFGVAGTTWTAMVAAVLPVVLLLTLTRSPWTLLTAAPLALPFAAWHRFRRPDMTHWDVRRSLYYLLLTFASWTATGVLAG